ncbi:hypothetical protein GCM10009642_67220 [Nocardiopsis metallicus]
MPLSAIQAGTPRRREPVPCPGAGWVYWAWVPGGEAKCPWLWDACWVVCWAA